MSAGDDLLDSTGTVSVIYVLMPLAFALPGAAVLTFMRATPDINPTLETHAHRILHDHEPS